MRNLYYSTKFRWFGCMCLPLTSWKCPSSKVCFHLSLVTNTYKYNDQTHSNHETETGNHRDSKGNNICWRWRETRERERRKRSTHEHPLFFHSFFFLYSLNSREYEDESLGISTAYITWTYYYIGLYNYDVHVRIGTLNLQNSSTRKHFSVSGVRPGRR